MRSLVLFAALSLFAHAAPCGPAAACSCFDEIPFDQARASADAIVLARALAVAPMPYPLELNGRTFTLDGWRTTLAIEARWKGARRDTMQVTGWSSCDVAFAPGQRYLIYAHRVAGEPGAPWSVTHCGRTQLADSAAADLAALGDPLEPR